MRVTLVSPAGPRSLGGNNTTAVRWRRLLEELGHATEVTRRWRGEPADVLIALHARKSFDSILAYHERRPGAPLIVTLTGTDLYRDLDRGDEVSRALEMATCVVALQPAALDRLPRALHGKVRVILQSAQRIIGPTTPATERFEVVVLSHLREIKDPLLVAAATHHLPEASRIVVRHGGSELDEELGRRARAETEANPRYRWLGPLSFESARDLLAGSRLLVLSSRDEGGANVVSEAIVAGVPVLSTDIPGSRGLLGKEYPGYYPVGDERALASLMSRAESEPAYLAELALHCRRLLPGFDPKRELAAWRELLAGIVPSSG
ncbi:MAG: selenoneine biosynthesis selenosugar synthase SenB [Gemmatimonadota bacterium]|nr:selenoneine biosynthesis selenosugar synthase SenB [Gemmatimonadota bacterium]